MNVQNEINNVVSWLKEEVSKSKVNGLIVGVSGGIDSAVASHLIKLACPDNSLGLIMPCESNPNDRLDALKVISTSKLEHKEVDLTETFKIYKNTVLNNVSNQLSIANSKARLRMTTLYAFAQDLNYLVVGTDNADEWHIGYFTKFGDGGVDLVPLVSFNKTEVREMAKVLGVSEDIINKKPSAGLWNGQTDENELGITYDEIDMYLSGEDVSDFVKTTVDRLHKVSSHKREMARGYYKNGE